MSELRAQVAEAVKARKMRKAKHQWETKGKATMAEWLNGGISSRADREEIQIRKKPNCGIAKAYLPGYTEQIDLDHQTLMETKPAGS